MSDQFLTMASAHIVTLRVYERRVQSKSLFVCEKLDAHVVCRGLPPPKYCDGLTQDQLQARTDRTDRQLLGYRVQRVVPLLQM